ncbi:MAG: D-TA family PLP-dependent enzyme [Saprospiraceae bacterium]|nr:D-TA family PLP-dependent enzyme [Saprospiraceae bacterium]MDG1432760.1 D-TA family PLP-dependent enzyme [Saprospiraceae bacterium]MDG2419083.1 D-TA family PLP-dependent enzyme [Saprospiraceae bacterium]
MKYQIQNIDEIDSPALVVYPHLVQQNIDRMKEIAVDVNRLRPHVKTHKMAEVVKMQMDNGIKKFKCATIAEAEMLGQAGAVSVLLSYQPVGPKVNRLAAIVEQFPQTNFACLVDDLAAAKNISRIFLSKNKTIEVWLDLNVGQNRTGIFADKRALDLLYFCNKLDGISPVGFHVYDGHIRDDNFEKRKKRSDECFLLVEKLLTKLKKSGHQIPKIVAGGSPTFNVHALRKNIDCSPGTCLFWDYGYQKMLPEQKFNWAALVISRIISKPSDHLLCVDLGHKSIAAENPFPRVHFINLPDAKQISQSEEHLVLEVGDNSKFQLGDVLYGVPIHICPTCSLYEKAIIVDENGWAKKEWKVIARDKKITI